MHRLNLIATNIGSLVTSSLNELSKVVVEKSEYVGTIWLNSPKDLNCLSTTMTTQIKQSLANLDADSQVKIIVIRSKLKKVFCAGADIKHMKENDYSVYPHNQHFLSVIRAFRALRKPVIAVVEGKALGGGFELALLTDIIVCSENAGFALPEITLGLIPGIGGTQFLTRIVGPKVASKMIFTGEPINAVEANRLKVAHLISPSGFEENLQKMLETLVNRAMDTLSGAKRAVKFSMESTLDHGLQHEASIVQSLATKPGPSEGIMAFIEKRKPDFRKI